MASVYTADGGVTKTPVDEKTNSLFGGGILGGLDLKPYLNDYSMDKSLNTVPKFTTITPAPTEEENMNGYLILLAVALGILAIIKTILD